MDVSAIILSTAEGGNIAVVNIEGMDETEACRACHLPLEEEFGESVEKVTFDDFPMLSITGKTSLEMDTDVGIRVIDVERTWIY